MTNITIHRALTLISNTEKELNTLLSTGLFLSLVKGENKKPVDASFKSEAELQKRIQSDTDKVEAGFKLITKLKTAINKSNLETIVNFNNQTVSITELLAIKQTLLLKEKYARKIREQIETCNRHIEVTSQNISKKADDTSTLSYYEKLEGLSIVTQNKTSPAERLSSLEQEILLLKTEVDILLSENNLRTMITIED